MMSALVDDRDSMHAYINQLYAGEPEQTTNAKYWFPTPETCSDPNQLNAIERRIFDEIIKLRQKESNNPQNSEQERQEFLANFNWDNTLLNKDEKQKIEEIRVKYHKIFARHRLDIG